MKQKNNSRIQLWSVHGLISSLRNCGTPASPRNVVNSAAPIAMTKMIAVDSSLSTTDCLKRPTVSCRLTPAMERAAKAPHAAAPVAVVMPPYDRQRVVMGERASVRVDLGVRRCFKKKRQRQ